VSATRWTRFVWILAALAAGVLFFLSLGRLWPLARIDLVADADRIETTARVFLGQRGFDVAGYSAASRLSVDDAVLDYVERALGADRAQDLIAAGYPVYRYRVGLKRRGEPSTYGVAIHPARGVVGWWRTVEEDETGPRLEPSAARDLALHALTDGLGLAAGEYPEISAATTEQPRRRDHAFVFEHEIATTPELRERVSVDVAGDRVVLAWRRLIVPGQARRDARAAEAPGRALESVGFLLLAVGAGGAFFVFLGRLRGGGIALGRSAVLPGVVFTALMITYGLETAALFDAWEPLWPRWVSSLRYLTLRAIEQAWILIVLLAVFGAGDALDRESGAGRGAALRALARGRLRDPGVGRASGVGFLVGLVCGGVMAGAVHLLGSTVGATAAIQPRGFFFYTLNSAAPAVTSLCFFLGVALAEELGYRYFAGGWLLRISGRRWLAVAVPAVVYGLTHTRLDFLPPMDPFWARPLVLTLVGCVWGVAFLRWGALTVVLSHLTADLFIFNWPRLASGDTRVIAVSVATIAVPLLPALLSRRRSRQLTRS